VDWIHLAQDRR